MLPPEKPPIASAPTDSASSVYSSARDLAQPAMSLTRDLSYGVRLKMEGLHLLSTLPDGGVPVVFFDPQYRGVLEHLSYGNEGETRGSPRRALRQMTGEIPEFVREIGRVLMPSGHLFLWMDKFHLCSGFADWITGTRLEVVDMITWSKRKLGMGYRSRRVGEHLVVLQQPPRRAKGVWTRHDIPDVWVEPVARSRHTHRKPVGLQAALIEAVSNPGDVIVDPAAGSFSVLEACELTDRRFLGCDING